MVMGSLGARVPFGMRLKTDKGSAFRVSAAMRRWRNASPASALQEGQKVLVELVLGRVSQTVTSALVDLELRALDQL